MAKRFSTVRRTSAATSGRSPPRLHDPPVQPVQVEQVRQQLIQLASVRGQAPHQVLTFLSGKVDLLPLEGQGKAEEVGERGPELVGHGVEELVLHLVQGPQALRRLALDRQGSFQVLLRLLARGDVVKDPLREAGLSALVPDHHGLAQHPHSSAVPGEEAVLTRDRFQGAPAPLFQLQDSSHVIRMQLPAPDIRGSHPLLGCEPKDGFDLGTDEEPPSLLAELRRVGDGRDALHQGSVLRLPLAELVLEPTPFGELALEIRIEPRVAQRDGGEGGELREQLHLSLAERAALLDVRETEHPDDTLGRLERHAQGGPEDSLLEVRRATLPGVVVLHHQGLARVPHLSGDALASFHAKARPVLEGADGDLDHELLALRIDQVNVSMLGPEQSSRPGGDRLEGLAKIQPVHDGQGGLVQWRQVRVALTK